MRILRFAVLLPLMWLAACATTTPETMRLTKISYSDIPDWHADEHNLALEAFLQSCKAGRPRWKSAADQTDLPALPSDRTWKQLCRTASNTPVTSEATRQFFEKHFTPYAVESSTRSKGLFTGYYAPILNGSRTQHGSYQYPVYRIPADGVAPRFDRKAIDEGALDGRELEILWLDDPVMRFFLEIQGSGLVKLENGQLTRLQYAGKNGHPYVAIGKVLIERGLMTKAEMSMPALRQWLYDHPEHATAIMQENPSYVFFKEESNVRHVLGAQGVPLTPKRSLAVDSRFIPYGLPVFLATELPAQATMNNTPRAFRQLMIAQDTGGAIRGVVRGDIFFGFGSEAEKPAGVMQSPGSLTLLIPSTHAD